MRTIIQEDGYETMHDRIYEVIKNWNPFSTSILVNGAPSMGKTTTLISDEVYNLLTQKFNNENLKILFIESRSMTRDQLRIKNTNQNINIVQFSTNEILTTYDLIIIDEAHSLFTDSEFDGCTTAYLCDFLQTTEIPQIYITASDIEFLEFAQELFKTKDFILTFPNIDEVHVRYTIQDMILSINSVSTKQVLNRREKLFLGKRGIFFVWSARQAFELAEFYNERGITSAFYVSQRNATKVQMPVVLDEDDEDITDFDGYTIYKQINVLDEFKRNEQIRRKNHQETIQEAILQGRIPNDIQWLFITAVGQEGISINIENNIDFIFVEDQYPLTINQKLFRYRGNLPFAYVSLQRRRFEKIFAKTLKQIQEMSTWSQEKLQGYYLGAKDAGGKYYKNILYQKEDGSFSIAPNYMTYLNKTYAKLKELNSSLSDVDYLREQFGLYARKFALEDTKQEEIKIKINELLRDKWLEKIILKEEKEEFVEDFKKIGVTNKHQKCNFSWAWIIKYWDEFCPGYQLVKKRAGKKDLIIHPQLKLRQEYYIVIKAV